MLVTLLDNTVTLPAPLPASSPLAISATPANVLVKSLHSATMCIVCCRNTHRMLPMTTVFMRDQCNPSANCATPYTIALHKVRVV